MTTESTSESPEEIARRRDEALARLLRMPPKPHEEMKLGRPPSRSRGDSSPRSVAEAARRTDG
jgi:hypothetical protein